jgi:hypothetical protein
MAVRDQPPAAASAAVVAVKPTEVEAGAAGEHWRNTLAELAYAQRHGSPAAELEQLANSVIEARVAMFQAGIAGGRALHVNPLPAYLQAIALP